MRIYNFVLHECAATFLYISSQSGFTGRIKRYFHAFTPRRVDLALGKGYSGWHGVKGYIWLSCQRK